MTEHVATECPECVATARRFLRVGRACASGLIVVGGAGIAITLLLTTSSLRPGQWLGVLVAMDVLTIATAACAHQAVKILELNGDDPSGWFGQYAIFGIAYGLLHLLYTVGYFPSEGHTVTTQLFSFDWWNLLVTGVIDAVGAALVRELFFAELLEAHPRLARPLIDATNR